MRLSFFCNQLWLFSFCHHLWLSSICSQLCMFSCPSAAVTVFLLFRSCVCSPLLQQLWLSAVRSCVCYPILQQLWLSFCCSQLCMFFPRSAAVAVFLLFAAVYVLLSFRSCGCLSAVRSCVSSPLLQQLWLSSCCSQLCMFSPPSAAVAVFLLFAAVYVLPSFSSCGF